MSKRKNTNSRFNQLVMLVGLPCGFIGVAASLGANVWVASALIIGLPVCALACLVLMPVLLDHIEDKARGETEVKRIDRYLATKRKNEQLKYCLLC
jgi:hypothetical protein